MLSQEAKDRIKEAARGLYKLKNEIEVLGDFLEEEGKALRYEDYTSQCARQRFLANRYFEEEKLLMKNLKGIDFISFEDDGFEFICKAGDFGLLFYEKENFDLRA